MTIRKTPYNGTSGTAITTVTEPTLSAVSAAGGASATYQTGAAFQGSTGARFVSDGTNAGYAQAPFASAATVGGVSTAFKIPASLPAADYAIGSIYDTANSRVLSLIYRTTGTVVASDKSSTYSTILTAAQAPAGTYFRFEIGVSALSATTGAYTAKAYNSSNVQTGTAVSVTNANLGTTAMSYFRHGATVAAAYTVDVDSVQTQDGSAAEIGPLAANSTPPTLVVGANQVAVAGGTAPLSATGTAYNGDTITSYAWTIVEAPTGATGQSLSSASAQNPTFTTGTGASGRYLLGCVVTDSSGNQSVQQIQKVFVRQTAIQVAAITTNVNGTVTVAATNDNSDSTFDDLPAGAVVTLRLQPLIANPTSFSLQIRDLLTALGGTQAVALLEGAAVRKDWGALPAITTANVAADRAPLTLSGPEIASVGSWDELDLRFTSS